MIISSKEFEEFLFDPKCFYNKNEFQIIHNDFPFSIIIEGCYPEHNVAVRWCWQHFGCMDGICKEHYSEYPSCPLVLATEKIKVSNDFLGNVYNDKSYDDPGEHSHKGNWKVIWLEKSGYDDSFQEYCFKNEVDMNSFKDVVITFDCGENYK